MPAEVSGRFVHCIHDQGVRRDLGLRGAPEWIRE
jgi:hypothetical protein